MGFDASLGSLIRCFGHATADDWRGRPRLRATVRVFSLSFFRKIVVSHDTGFGKAYMDGDFEVDDIGGLLAVVVSNAVQLQQQRGALGIVNWVGARMLHWAHLQRANTVEGSRRNIEQHYDAGNDMYKYAGKRCKS